MRGGFLRGFVRLRDLLASNKALNDQLNDLERKYLHHDKAIATILATIRGLLASPGERRRGIGFTADID